MKFYVNYTRQTSYGWETISKSLDTFDEAEKYFRQQYQEAVQTGDIEKENTLEMCFDEEALELMRTINTRQAKL